MKADESPHETAEVAVSLKAAPVQPTDLVVLAIGVVVALLGAPGFVAHEQHGSALGKEQNGDEVLDLPAAQRFNRRVLGGTFHAAIPRVIVVGPVAVLLAVGLVVLVVEGNQVVEREAVMGR